MRPVKGAKPGDPYFVWLTVAMLAAFGLGLTHPHRASPTIVETNAAAPPPAIPAAFLRAGGIDDRAEPIGVPAPPVRGPSGAATIAIVIDDLGASPEASNRAAALPEAVTLSFLPLGPGVARLVEAARARGHDILLHLPMEAVGADAGPQALRVSDSAAAIAAKLTAGLSFVPGAVGINNHMGSRFTADAQSVSRLAQAMRGRDLIFLDSRTTGRSLAARFVKAAGLPVAQRDIFIDHPGATREDVLAALSRAEDAALSKGSAVVIAHPYANTLAALEAWCARVDRRALRLVSLSDHTSRRPGGGHLASLARVPASAY